MERQAAHCGLQLEYGKPTSVTTVDHGGSWWIMILLGLGGSVLLIKAYHPYSGGIFNGWGDKGIGCIVEHDVFDRFYGDKSVKYRALKETIAKTWKHIQRTRDLGDYLGVVV